MRRCQNLFMKIHWWLGETNPVVEEAISINDCEDNSRTIESSMTTEHIIESKMELVLVTDIPTVSSEEDEVAVNKVETQP